MSSNQPVSISIIASISPMRCWARASLGSLDGSSSASRSRVRVGSISRFFRSSARVRKIIQTSSGVEKYSRRSPVW